MNKHKDSRRLSLLVIIFYIPILFNIIIINGKIEFRRQLKNNRSYLPRFKLYQFKGGYSMILNTNNKY